MNWIHLFVLNQIIRIARMADDEEFYKALPFTLPPQQCSPPYVIFGTGLQECLLAAHYSKIEMKPGLILDIDRTYGSCLKTVTFKELHSLTTQKTHENLYQFIQVEKYENSNKMFYDELVQNKSFKGFNIDIEPNYFFGSSITCDLLKDADMDKYMDFRIVHNMLHLQGNTLKSVPLSKGKIFESKDLGLLQKKLLLNCFHSLTQIYNKYTEAKEDHNSTKEFDKQFGQVDEKLYADFLKNLNEPLFEFLGKLTKNNVKITNYIIYIICNYQYSFTGELPEHVRSEYKLGRFIERFGKFLKSCGVYGEGPYLYVDNGIGDVPQAFSRVASIYGATYILHPKIAITKIEHEEQGVKIFSNLCPEGCIKTDRVYYGPTFYDLKFNEKTEYNRQFSLRTILICSKLGQEQECPSIAYLINTAGFDNPIYLFMFDHTSHTCPQDYIIYQFETVVGSEQIDSEVVSSKVENIVNILRNVRGEAFTDSIKYVSAYLREKRYPKSEIKAEESEVILRDHTGIDLDSHFLNFKEIVGPKEHYFRKEKKQQNEEDEWAGDNETVGLIQKLSALQIHTDEGKDDANEQQEQGEKNEQKKEQKKEQKIPQNSDANEANNQVKQSSLSATEGVAADQPKQIEAKQVAPEAADQVEETKGEDNL